MSDGFREGCVVGGHMRTVVSDGFRGKDCVGISHVKILLKNGIRKKNSPNDRL